MAAEHYGDGGFDSAGAPAESYTKVSQELITQWVLFPTFVDTILKYVLKCFNVYGDRKLRCVFLLN